MIAAVIYRFKGKLVTVSDFYPVASGCMPFLQVETWCFMVVALGLFLVLFQHYINTIYKGSPLATTPFSLSFISHENAMTNEHYIDSLQRLYQLASTGFKNALDRFSSPFQSYEKSGRVVAYLQFADILAQRVEHLIGAHQKVMTLYIDDIFKESFLHLQYHQFDMIAHDLMEAMNGLETEMNYADDELQVKPLANIHASIVNLISSIKFNLRNEAGDLKLTALPPLTKRQATICSQLYTMESERIVFQWFHCCSIRRTVELRQYYQSQIAALQHKTVDIF